MQHYAGALLCYTFGKDFGRIVLHMKALGLRNGDSIVFCFGEIDCRAHVFKHVTPERSYQDVIGELVKNYLLAVRRHIAALPVQLRHVCVFNVPPPPSTSMEEIAENAAKAAAAGYINPNPFRGPPEERLKYARYFNQLARELCPKLGITFIDVYDKYADANGYMNESLSDGGLHIADGRHITEFLRERLELRPPAPPPSSTST